MTATVAPQRTPEHAPGIITAGGWARSGKGTSMAHLRAVLEGLGKDVTHIDQGLKFRAMSVVALQSGEMLDSPATLDHFLRETRTREATFELLAEIEAMGEAQRKSLLYSEKVQGEVRKVGAVPSAHEVAVGLMRNQVETAVEGDTDVILIDGRAIETYARQYTEEGIARFAMGWYFKCDPAIAARRSLGMFSEIDALPDEDKIALLKATFNISDRNRSDMQRSVDPLRDPRGAYELDLFEYAAPDREYTPYKISRDIVHDTPGSMAMVDTSYAVSIEQMTQPVTELSKFALLWAGALTHEDVGIRTVELPAIQ